MAASFGDLVRRGREEAGLSQSRLAHLIGKSPTTIRSWEHGRTSPSDPRSVAAVAAVLGLDETELLGQAGFEASPARSRPSARQELTNLASERTEAIALAPAGAGAVPGEVVSEPETTVPGGTVPERTVPEIAVPEIAVPEIAVPETTVPEIPVPGVPELERSEPEAEDFELPGDQGAPGYSTPEIEIVVEPVKVPAPDLTVAIPIVEVPEFRGEGPQPAVALRKPKVRMIVVPQAAPAQSSPNGFVSGRSYMEDETEKEFYRRRFALTAVVLIFLVIVMWWALGRTGGAIGDFIESIIGLLDI